MGFGVMPNAQPGLYQTVAPAPQHAQDAAQNMDPSLPSPPRDHVAPKAYESVTIAVGRNCPPALRRQVWHVSDFDLRKLMYNGAISMVYHAVDKRSGITVALKLYKRIKLNEIERHQVAREIRLHSDLAHDSIIGLYSAWKDRAYVYLALEWAPGGDVYSYLKSQRGRLAEELAVPLILEPFMAGLAAIHERGLIHRDIKPENILLTNSFQVKIADFGLSIDSKQEIANTRLGTIDYLAPEILDCPVKHHPDDHKDRPETGYTNRVDCWSVGVLAYELLVGTPPFAAPSSQETLRLIRTKKVEYPAWLSPDSVSFMTSVLVRDPTVRPSIAELLNHPWIVKFSRREGLGRNRPRMLTRRGTVDCGQLVRSNTNEHAHVLQQSNKALGLNTQGPQQQGQGQGQQFGGSYGGPGSLASVVQQQQHEGQLVHSASMSSAVQQQQINYQVQLMQHLQLQQQQQFHSTGGAPVHLHQLPGIQSALPPTTNSGADGGGGHMAGGTASMGAIGAGASSGALLTAAAAAAAALRAADPKNSAAVGYNNPNANPAAATASRKMKFWSVLNGGSASAGGGSPAPNFSRTVSHGPAANGGAPGSASAAAAAAAGHVFEAEPALNRTTSGSTRVASLPPVAVPASSITTSGGPASPSLLSLVGNGSRSRNNSSQVVSTSPVATAMATVVVSSPGSPGAGGKLADVVSSPRGKTANGPVPPVESPSRLGGLPRAV